MRRGILKVRQRGKEIPENRGKTKLYNLHITLRYHDLLLNNLITKFLTGQLNYIFVNKQEIYGDLLVSFGRQNIYNFSFFSKEYHNNKKKYRNFIYVLQLSVAIYKGTQSMADIPPPPIKLDGPLDGLIFDFRVRRGCICAVPSQGEMLATYLVQPY